MGLFGVYLFEYVYHVVDIDFLLIFTYFLLFKTVNRIIEVFEIIGYFFLKNITMFIYYNNICYII